MASRDKGLRDSMARVGNRRTLWSSEVRASGVIASATLGGGHSLQLKLSRVVPGLGRFDTKLKRHYRES